MATDNKENIKYLDLTSINPVTITALNKPILQFIAVYERTPDKIILTVDQMVELTGLYIVNSDNLGWTRYRGIPVKLLNI